MKGPYCKKDEEFIPPEIWNLWNELIGKIGCYHLNAYAIYHHISDEVYYGQGGPPPPINEDILCIISYEDKQATYTVKDKDFETIKEYISALKNLAFL